MIQLHLALVLVKYFNQIQGRINLFCKRMDANVGVTRLMKQAVSLNDVQVAIRVKGIGQPTMNRTSQEKVHLINTPG